MPKGQFIFDQNPDSASPQRYILRYKAPNGQVSAHITSFRTIDNISHNLVATHKGPWFCLADSGGDSLWGRRMPASLLEEPQATKTGQIVSVQFENGKERTIFFDIQIKKDSSAPELSGASFAGIIGDIIREGPEFEDEPKHPSEDRKIVLTSPPSSKPN